MKHIFTLILVALVSVAGYSQVIHFDNQTNCTVRIWVGVEDCADWAHTPASTNVLPWTTVPNARDWANPADWVDAFSLSPMSVPCFWDWAGARLTVPGVPGFVLVGPNVTNCIGTFPSSAVFTDCAGIPISIDWNVLPGPCAGDVLVHVHY